MTETTETINLPGGDITVTRTGSGPQLLLLHGGGGPVMSLPFIDELARHFEIIAPVHPGFAGTSVPDHFDGMADLVFFYLDVIDALDLKDATLVGMSMGGWLAAELASISCANIKRLVLVDAVGVKHGGPTDRDIADTFAEPIDKLMNQGHATFDGDTLALTRDGLLRVDGLLPNFFEPQFRGIRYT